MVSRRGISVLDLVLGVPGGIATVLVPDDLRATLESFAVLEHTSTTTANAYVHEGITQALGDEPLALPKVAGYTVESPVVTTGMRFRVVRTRTTAGSGQNVEPPSVTTTIDLHLDPVAVTLPHLQPAIVAGGDLGSANAAHLVPDPNREGVRVSGRAILRITLGSPGSVTLVDWPDPFNPIAPPGAVAELAFDPPSFLFGGSGFGATIDRVSADMSPNATPPEVLARGQDATWQGIALREGTVYFPRNAPIVGDLSIGLHDLLIGFPPANGIQGELAIEFGRTPVNPTVVSFVDADGLLATEANAAGYTFVYLRGASAEVTATLPAAVEGLPEHPTADWTLPDGSRRENVSTTGAFAARLGDRMRVAFTELVDERTFPGEEEVYVFTLDSAVVVDLLPTIGVDTGAALIAHVASVSGSVDALNGVLFVADPGDADGVAWQLGEAATAQVDTGPTFAPRFDGLALGTHQLVARRADGATRRAEIQVTDQGALVVGSAAGPRDATGGDLGVRQLLATYDLATFDRDGRRVTASTEATSAGGAVDVPDGALAFVSAAIGTAADPDEPVPPDAVIGELRHVEVLMVFDRAGAVPSQFYRPSDGAAIDAATHVLDWAASFDDAHFLVLGRCCDLGTDSYNETLGAARAELAAGWIEPTSAEIVSRSELAAAVGRVAEVQDEALAAGLLDAADIATGQLITLDGYGSATDDDSNLWPRPLYRRADIYAVGGSPTDATPPAFGELMPLPALREALLPGADLPTPAAAPRNPKLPFRTRLTVGWDSPSVHDPADAIPTLAELIIEWARQNVTLPDAGDIDVVAGTGATSSTEVFLLTGRWTHDPQSGQTMFSLAWDSSGDPDGLAHVDNRFLALALALGPALLAGIGDATELGVSLVSLVGAALLLAPIVTDGNTVLHGIEYQITPLQGGPLQRLVVDYSVELGFDSSALTGAGIQITTDADHPMRVRYRNVGLEFDLSGQLPWYETLRLVYDDVSMEIEDPGAWTINGPLGEVLRVVGTRAGSGSTWTEVDLEFLIDLGVVALEKATVRLTIDDDGSFGVGLRGLTVTVDVPGTLKGTGSLSIGADDTFRAGIDVEVIPARLKVGAALALEPASGFFFLQVDVILPVGIPLGPTGLGLYGFVGRFVTNGTRAIDTSVTDIVTRELRWHRELAPQDKYRPQPGQWALGLGAVVGTAVDTGFTFNALGMFVVSFPDPSVIFGLDAHFLASPGTASDDPDDIPEPAASGEISGLAVFDASAVVIAVDGRYSLPKVLDLRVPVGAYFPGVSSETYVRVGSDGYEGRDGDPVTATLLPEVLDAHVWSYLMIEGGGLANLGGDPRFSFDGFSVGFGAGWSVEWKAGPVRLSASAKVLVGLGTKPFLLVGGVFMEGELSLAFVSIGASGELVATVQEDRVYLEGELCATFGLGFLEHTECVGIAIGDPLVVAAPPPDCPLLKVSCVDRRGIVVQQMDNAHRVAAAPVWPDTVIVLEFAHPLESALDAGSAFQPGTAPAGPAWSGSSKLQYAFRLSGVELRADGVAVAGPLDSTWWWSTNRPGVIGEGDLALTAAEGRWLALMSWDPRPWARLLGSDNLDSPGEPSVTVSRLCDPPLQAARTCAFGADAVRTGTSTVELRSPVGSTAGAPSSNPLATSVVWRVTEHLGPIGLVDAAGLAAHRGWNLRPGTVAAVPHLAGVPQVPAGVEAMFSLAHLADGLGPLLSLQASGRYEPALLDAELTLLVCPASREPVLAEPVCVDFADFADAVPVEAGVIYKGLRFVAILPGDIHLTEQLPPADVPEIGFDSVGMRVELGVSVGRLRVRVGSGTELDVLVDALDASGAVVDSGRCPGGSHRTIRLSGAEPIVVVVLTGGGGEGVLAEICIDDPLVPGSDAGDDDGGPGWPIVVGTPVSGRAVRWNPTEVATVRFEGVDCAVVRYDPPEQGDVWTAGDVLPWGGGRVGVLSTCGVSWAAAQMADDQAAAVDDVIADWTGRLLALDPERPDLLDAQTDHSVVVSWDYQSWISTTDGSAQPPPTSAGAWIPGTPVTYTFTTAAAVPDDELPVEVDLNDEATFDPRSVQRYLLGVEPAGGEAMTHFRDDDILVHFSVDHVDLLLDRYDRTLAFTIRRTDPPPGSTAAGTHRLATLDAAYGHLPAARLDDADARFVAAANLLDCVDPPRIGGTTAHLPVILERRARYDLNVVAAAGRADQVDVMLTVTNFVASRYGGPRDLLDALGLTDPAGSPVLPHDAIVDSEPPRGAAALVVGDAGLDATLATLGLDPWPLSNRPRLVALWRPDGTAGGWWFDGVLIEADEPIGRPGRLEIATITAGGVTLEVVRVSSSGARILATPASAQRLAGESVVEVVLTSTTLGLDGRTSDATIVGTRRLLDRPRLAYQEGVEQPAVSVERAPRPVRGEAAGGKGRRS